MTVANLTIGAVAAETDVSVGVLRAWELRYGFPTPDRLPSGHRRYSAIHVDQIRQVIRDRDDGMSLAAAIDRVRTRDGRPASTIFAGLRRRWPDLPVQVLSQRALLAISRAIEDECAAQADRPVLVGSFQREREYRRSERRWRELARTASSAMVFADFRRSRQRRGGVTEISVPPDAPLLREWAVVCDAPDAAACLAAIERPANSGRRKDRRFDAVWSLDPTVVRVAADIAADLAADLRQIPPPTVAPRPTSDLPAILRSATAVLNRTVAYLDR